MRIIRKKSQVVKTGRRIALFGGSFNPPHRGHVAIVRHLLRRREIDQVWIVPVFRHPWGKTLLPYADRVALCRLAFARLSPRVKLRHIEKKLGGVSYAVRTLRVLHKQYPDVCFMLVLGGDSYRRRRQWKNFQFIEKNADLIIFPRGRHSPIPNVSSTQIRQGKNL